MALGSIKVLFQKQNFGLLFIRLCLGGIMIMAGLSKFQGGKEGLSGVGKAIEVIGVSAPDGSILPFFFGIMAAGTELLGGLALIVGYLFRPAVVGLLGVMAVATTLMYNLSDGDMSKFGYPMFVWMVLFGLLFTGPGTMSVQKD